jgi:hypothetical protein
MASVLTLRLNSFQRSRRGAAEHGRGKTGFAAGDAELRAGAAVAIAPANSIDGGTRLCGVGRTWDVDIPANGWRLLSALACRPNLCKSKVAVIVPIRSRKWPSGLQEQGAGDNAVRSGGLAWMPLGGSQVRRSDDIEVIQDLANSNHSGTSAF